MADKSLLSRIFTRESGEVKQLRDRLSNIQDEYTEALSAEVKFVDAEASSFSGGFHTDFTAIDQQVDNAALQRVYSTETWVYVAVNAIAKTIAGLPTKLEKRKEYQKQVKNQYTGEMENVTQVAWLDASGEKLNKRFQSPNQFTTAAEFYMLLTIDLETTGEYYIFLDSDQDLSAIQADRDEEEDPNSPFGRLRALLSADTPIKAMYRIPPSFMKPVPSEHHTHIDGYVMQSDRGSYVFNTAEIIHVKLPNPMNPFNGLSPLIAAFKPVLLDRFSTEHMIRFYKSGARLGGVINTDKALNREQLGRFQRSFEASYTGRNNHHRTLILPPGMKYEQIGQNPAETALLEFCRYNREAILAAYNVPPIKVGIMDHANYANAYIQLKIFFQDTIIPLLAFIEGGFNGHSALMPDSAAYRFKFDLSNVEALQENFKDKAEAAKAMIDGGLTVNEVRKKIWLAEEIKDGEKCKVIEEMKNPNIKPATSILSAPQPEIQKEAAPDAQADTALLSSVKPTDMSFSERVSQLVSIFMQQGLPVTIAVPKAIDRATLEGFTDDDNDDPQDPNSPPNKPKPDKTQDENHAEMGTGIPPNDGKDGESLTNSIPGLSTENQNEIIPTMVSGDNIPEYCHDCGYDKESCKCDGEAKTASDKPSLANYIADAVSKLNDSEEVTADFLNDLKRLYKETYGEVVDNKEEAILPVKQYANGMTKDHIVAHWKTFLTKTDPLIEKRHAELKKFFHQIKRVVTLRFGANLKSYGMHKARDNDDASDITKASAFEGLIKDYIDQVDDALLDGYQQGYMDTLVDIDFGKAPSEEAIKALREYATDRVTGIVDTTRDQLKALLEEKFKSGASMGEIGTAINDKFHEIDMGRAMTIARTEALTAVSLGQQAKADDVQKEFPDKKFKSMWVSAQDDRVRDSHADIDGTSVELGDTFENGLKFPRDPDGDASEVINCRCTTVEYAAEDQDEVEATLPEKDSSDQGESEAGTKGGPGSGRHATGRELKDSTTEMEKQALRYYSGTGYASINGVLRGFNPQDADKAKEMIKNIDTAIDKSSISKDTTVYRGMYNVPEIHDLEKDAIGKEIKMPTYWSASSSKETASQFSFGEKGVLFKINLPSGSKGLDMDSYKNTQEPETLLPRGQSYVITGYSKQNGISVYTMEPK